MIHSVETRSSAPDRQRSVAKRFLRRQKARRSVDGREGRPRRFRTGAAATMRMFLAPLGQRAARFQLTLQSEAHLQKGLVVLLPGIDGCTSISDNIARGLIAQGFDGAVEVHDWRSFRGWNPLHLATSKRNRQSADQISERLIEYSEQHPGRPIHLVGHSAGAGMALFVLEQLPVHLQV